MIRDKLRVGVIKTQSLNCHRFPVEAITYLEMRFKPISFQFILSGHLFFIVNKFIVKTNHKRRVLLWQDIYIPACQLEDPPRGSPE